MYTSFVDKYSLLHNIGIFLLKKKKMYIHLYCIWESVIERIILADNIIEKAIRVVDRVVYRMMGKKSYRDAGIGINIE